MTLAFVFPGQGSQSVGMMKDFAQSTDVVGQTFEQASRVLGFDLWDIVQHGPRERLDMTEVTQPAMLSAGVATWRAWCEQGGPRPEVMAGHSLGEYTALVCNGALDFDEAVALVEFRAQTMQRAVPAGAGAMAAILGLDDAAVESACAACSGGGSIVEPVNYNAPGQVVIAGHTAAVQAAIEAARGAGARRAVALPVSVPSHSSLMLPAAQQYLPRLSRTALRPPHGAKTYSVDLEHHADVEGMRKALVAQLHKPVRWVAIIETMIERDGVDAIVECGPGQVLHGLNRRITRRRGIELHSLSDAQSLQQARQALTGDCA